ncbi:MAG: FtsQ-type POTRA domain-containing protein [Oscillospiraceae bacterium]|nr:FtsQ-type POTRA domain-containing protein [Oscillospiraceae bacterium]
MAAKKRRRRRRKSSGFFLSVITFCIVIAAIITSVTVFLKVAEVQVTGTTRYDAADIIATSGIETGDNMFMINKFDVAERILDKYPYIEQIKIRRKLPDTFTFEITERVPAAYIENQGNRWLIDNNAYILEMLTPEAKVTVPKVSGCVVKTPYAGSMLDLENPDQLPVIKEVLTALRYADMGQNIVRVEVEKLYDINIIYGDRFLVALGDTTKLSKKIEMLRAVIAELTDFDKGTINVSAVKEARFKPNASIDLSEKPRPAPQNTEPAGDTGSEESTATEEVAPDEEETSDGEKAEDTDDKTESEN